MDPTPPTVVPPKEAATTAPVEESMVVGMLMQQPVSSIGGFEEEKKMKVMVAMDESDGSFYALRWALDHLFSGTTQDENESRGRVTVVNVQQPLQHYVFPAGPGGTAFYASASLVDSLRKAQEENSALILSRALQCCRTKMVKAETLILTGDPKDMICQAAEEMHMDLLVVGSRGLGKIKRAFLGSVSDYCTHHAKCPVLIVKPPKEMTNNNK